MDVERISSSVGTCKSGFDQRDREQVFHVKTMLMIKMFAKLKKPHFKAFFFVQSNIKVKAAYFATGYNSKSLIID